jgi:hypothetical protein
VIKAVESRQVNGFAGRGAVYHGLVAAQSNVTELVISPAGKGIARCGEVPFRLPETDRIGTSAVEIPCRDRLKVTHSPSV